MRPSQAARYNLSGKSRAVKDGPSTAIQLLEVLINKAASYSKSEGERFRLGNVRTK